MIARILSVLTTALLLLACSEKPAEVTHVAGAGLTGAESDHDPKSRALPAPLATVLAEATEVQLFGLFWVPVEDAALPADLRGRERFHGYPILGVTDVTDQKDAVLAAVSKGVAENHGDAMSCFDPRHALRVKTAAGRTADLVICFECWQIQATIDGRERVSMLTSDHAAPLLDQLLRKGKVPEYKLPAES